MAKSKKSTPQVAASYHIRNRSRVSGLLAQALFGLVLLAFGVYLLVTQVPYVATLEPPTSTSALPSDEIVGVILGACVAVAGCASIRQGIEYYNASVSVDGEALTIRDWKRHVSHANLDDVKSVELRPFFFLTAKTSERFVLLDSEGGVIASLDKAMENVEMLVAELDRRGVKLVRTDGNGPMLDSLTSFFGVDLSGTSLAPGAEDGKKVNKS